MDQDAKKKLELKHRVESFNKLLLTIYEDLLDKFVFKTYENLLEKHKIVYKVVDFAPLGEGPDAGEFVVRLQRLVDANGILIDWKATAKKRAHGNAAQDY